jgi:hypothetical protein
MDHSPLVSCLGAPVCSLQSSWERALAWRSIASSPAGSTKKSPWATTSPGIVADNWLARACSPVGVGSLCVPQDLRRPPFSRPPLNLRRQVGGCPTSATLRLKYRTRHFSSVAAPNVMPYDLSQVLMLSIRPGSSFRSRSTCSRTSSAPTSGDACSRRPSST